MEDKHADHWSRMRGKGKTKREWWKLLHSHVLTRYKTSHYCALVLSQITFFSNLINMQDQVMSQFNKFCEIGERQGFCINLK